MWQAEFDRAFADPDLSEFQRQVLQDYEVTQAEFQEAQARFAECMAGLGWLVENRPDGTFTTRGLPGSGHDQEAVSMEVMDGCQKTTTYYIVSIYVGLQTNPGGLTWEEQIRACYEARGVPDGAGLSADEFAAMVDDTTYHASTPEGKLCFWDPIGSLGLTVEQAEQMDATAGRH